MDMLLKESSISYPRCRFWINDTTIKHNWCAAADNKGSGDIESDADYDRIMAAYEQLVNKPVAFPALFGDGHASEKIIKEILDYLNV